LARKIEVEILGDSRSLERAFDRSTRSAKSFGRDVEHAGRGALTASVGFRGLGRAVGFASASFLGGAGLVAAITSTVRAAEEAQRVLGQTRNAVRRSGLSWAEYGDHIQEVSKATSQLSGFDDEKLMGTFSNLVRRTGDVNRALHLNALAADVARGRNISLEAASGLVLKASIGNVGALRRLGINLGKHATALEAIDLLTRRYAGSAAAYGRTAAGAQDRFRVALENMQEVLGAEFLPVITKYLNKAAKWLDNSENQQRVLNDVKEAVGLVTGVLRTLKGVLDTVNAVTGSTKETLKLLLGALVAFRTARFLGLFEGIAGAITGVGTEAQTSTGKVVGLRGALRRLGAIGIITVEIELIVHSKGLGEKVGEALANAMGRTESDADLAKVPKAKSPFEFFSKGFDITDTMVAGLIQRHKLSLDQIKKLRSRFTNDFQYQLALLQAQGVAATRKAAETAKHLAAVAARGPHDLPTVQAAAPILGRGALTPMRRAQLAESAAALTTTTKDNLAALTRQRELLARAIRVETARLNQATTVAAAKSYADALESMQGRLADVQGRIVEITRKGAAVAKRTGAEIAAQRNQWFDTSIGRMIDRVTDIPTLKGKVTRLRQAAATIQQQIASVSDITRKQTLGDTLVQVMRQIDDYNTQITQAGEQARQTAIDTRMGWLDFAVERAGATKTIRDDVKAQQAIIKYLQGRVKQEGRTLELVRGIWEARQKIRDLRKGKDDVDPLAGLRQVSSRQLANTLAAGTGLSAGGRRILGMNIAGAEIQPVHVHVHMDGREVASVVSKQQARTGRRTAKQTSGFRG
jgi:hypothetical protein